MDLSHTLTQLYNELYEVYRGIKMLEHTERVESQKPFRGGLRAVAIKLSSSERNPRATRAADQATDRLV
jgi:hypothetical protein